MVKLKLFLLLTYFGVISLTCAQEIAPLSQKDSVDFLVALAAKTLESNPQQAEALIARAYTHAVETQYIAGEGKALFMRGRIFSAANKNEESIDAYLKAGRLFESLKDSSRAGRSYHGAANIYIYKLLHHTKAYAYCTKAISLLQHDSIYLSKALSNLAALHLQTGKFDEALTIYKKSYESERRHNNLPGMCVALNNIATVYDSKKDLKASIAYYEKALAISRALGDNKNTAHILLGLVPIYCQFNGHEKAKQTLVEIVALSEKHSLFDKQISALQYLAEESQHLGKKEKALAYSLQAKRLAEQHGLHAFKGSIYQQLSHIYKKNNDHALALQYHQKYSQFQDSLANQERLAVTSLEFNKNNAVAETKDTDHAESFSGWMIALSMSVLIPGMFFIFYKKRKQREVLQHHTPITSQQPQQDHLSVNEPAREAYNDTPHPAIQHLEVINGEGIKLLALNNIWWFQKEGKTYHAFTESGNYRVRQNITELEQALPKNKFFRINRAVIINTDQMSNYSFWENHKYIIRMKDVKKSEFVISRSRLREMKETFQVLEGN
jgi:tetratricopeptide (TPR) repeat protein